MLVNNCGMQIGPCLVRNLLRVITRKSIQVTETSPPTFHTFFKSISHRSNNSTYFEKFEKEHSKRKLIESNEKTKISKNPVVPRNKSKSLTNPPKVFEKCIVLRKSLDDGKPFETYEFSRKFVTRKFDNQGPWKIQNAVIVSTIEREISSSASKPKSLSYDNQTILGSTLKYSPSFSKRPDDNKTQTTQFNSQSPDKKIRSLLQAPTYPALPLNRNYSCSKSSKRNKTKKCKTSKSATNCNKPEKTKCPSQSAKNEHQICPEVCEIIEKKSTLVGKCGAPKNPNSKCGSQCGGAAMSTESQEPIDKKCCGGNEPAGEGRVICIKHDQKGKRKK